MCSIRGALNLEPRQEVQAIDQFRVTKHRIHSSFTANQHLERRGIDWSTALMAPVYFQGMHCMHFGRENSCLLASAIRCPARDHCPAFNPTGIQASFRGRTTTDTCACLYGTPDVQAYSRSMRWLRLQSYRSSLICCVSPLPFESLIELKCISVHNESALDGLARGGATCFCVLPMLSLLHATENPASTSFHFRVWTGL